MAVEERTEIVAGEADSQSWEMIDLLVSLGVEINTAKTLMCLHIHGPTTSRNLQISCNLRQPDVSISINALKKMNLVRSISTSTGSRGRPSHVYELSVPLSQALIPFKEQAVQKLSVLQGQLSRLTELAESVTDSR